MNRAGPVRVSIRAGRLVGSYGLKQSYSILRVPYGPALTGMTGYGQFAHECATHFRDSSRTDKEGIS